MASPRGLLLVVAALVALGARPSTQDLVVSSTTPPPPPPPSTTTTPALPPLPTAGPSKEAEGEGAASADSRPDVYSLHVTSRVAHRYARTVVSSRLANRAPKAQEAQFSLVLPETAFISAFLIETEGKVYEAYVKEKEEAKKEYDAALASGQTAAHVAVSARDANTFNVAVNVAPGQKVTFNLTYEELLARRLGAYTHAVHVAPGQVVRDLRVEVLIEESRNLSALRDPAFRPADAELDADANDADKPAATPGVTAERLGGGRAKVVFAPTPDQQREIAAALAAKSTEPKNPFHAPKGPAAEGLVGQLVVQYDVERDPQGGEVLLDQGYFVHFFAPDELPPLPKHVIFVLDVSGSMEGRKVQQLKEAMTTILGDLKPGDYFNLLEFSYSVTVWNLDSASNNVVYSPYSVYGAEKPSGPAEPPAPAAYPASAEYVQKAKEIVNKMTAGGGTNIHDALRTALAVARDGLRNVTLPEGGPRPEPIVVFLTDGEPTVGESRPHKIFQMVSERNEHPTSALFSLAFGDDADLPFLKKLSLRNAGFARKIYEAADAALQLRNFYRQVASPLLSNVTFEYASEDVKAEAVTKKRFPTYFAGSELVVAGRVAADAVGGAVVARGGAGEKRFPLPEPLILLPHPPHPLPPAPPAPGSKKNAPSLERLWAYLSIRQLLDEREANSGFEDQYADSLPKANLTEAQQEARDAADAAKKRALELALQYSFVTPLTSLVVVKPNGTSAADLEGARRPGVPFSSAGFPGVNLKSGPIITPANAFVDIRATQPVDHVNRISGGHVALDAVAYDEADLSLDALVPEEQTVEESESESETETASALGAGGGFSGAQFAFASAPGIPGQPGQPGRPAAFPGPPPPFYPSTTFRPPPPQVPLATSAPDARPEGTEAPIPQAEQSTSAAPAHTSSPASSPAPAPAPALGTLSDLAWLTNALNGTTGSLLVPLANGTRLLRLGVSEENKPFEECALPSDASSGAGAAHCRHLPHCVLPDISKDMQSYVRYFCSIGDYAGVCCPDAAFPTASHA